MSELILDEARRMVAVIGDTQASAGWSALAAYTQNMYHCAAQEPAAQGLQDLLGDLLHLSDALSLEPGSTLTVDAAEALVDDFNDDINDDDAANEARAGNGWVGFYAYVAEKHGDTQGVNVSASLLSLIADLKQFAVVTELDFETINADAIETHQIERLQP